MTKLEQAVELEVAKKLAEAATIYEQIISESDAPLEAFTSLAFLYSEATDFGVLCGLGLSNDFVGTAATRYPEVLEEATQRFGDLPELKFWKRFFKFINLGEQPFEDECLLLVNEPNASLVPYFHIFSQTNDPQYIPQAKLLWEQIYRQFTFKNRYIMHHIESPLARIAPNELKNLPRL